MGVQLSKEYGSKTLRNDTRSKYCRNAEIIATTCNFIGAYAVECRRLQLSKFIKFCVKHESYIAIRTLCINSLEYVGVVIPVLGREGSLPI